MESKGDMNDSKPSSNFQQQAIFSQKPQEAMEKKEDKTMSDNENPLSQNARICDSAIRDTPEVPLINLISNSMNRFYKSKLCTEFEEGFCSYGNSCSYAHGTRDLRCDVFFRTNACKNGDKCWNRHISDPLWNVPGSSEPRPLAWKTKMCPHWKRERRCNSGGMCKFAHGSAELRSLYGEIPLTSSSPKTSMSEDMLANNHEEEEHSVKKPSRIETLSRKLVGIYGDWIDES